MIEYVLTVLIILAILIYFKFYYEPQRILKNYQKIIEAQGYKVKRFPVEFLGCPIITQFDENTSKFGDASYNYKHEYNKYDVILYNIMGTPILEFLNTDLMKNFFSSENIYVHYKMKSFVENFRRCLGSGVIFSEGKQWKRKRKIINAVFNYDFIIEGIPKIVSITQQFFNSVEKLCQAKGKCEKIDSKEVFKMNLQELFAEIYSNILFECFFGSKLNKEAFGGESIGHFVRNLVSDADSQNFQLPVLLFGTTILNFGIKQRHRDINRRIKLLKEFGESLIQKRLAQIQKSVPKQKYQDFVEAFVQKKAENEASIKTEKQYYAELIDEFCGFFIAGIDTTTSFTEMMVYLISQNKEIQKKLRKQIDEVIKSDEDITKQNLKKLTYIDWIQNETTRYYGPTDGVMPRIALKDHFIEKIPIKKGHGVAINSAGAHFNEKYYKNPLEFRPERWESECNKNHPFALLGFSAGPRSCLGKHLAMLQSKIVLVKFMRRYKQITPPKHKLIYELKLIYQPKYFEMQLSK